MNISYTYQDSLNFLKDSEWSKLTIQERAAVMQAVEIEVARREGRPPCNVSLFSEPPKDGKIIAGQYNPDNRGIELNAYHLSGNPVECLNTVLHEGRHAYQDSAVRGEVYHHDKAELKAWQENMKPGNYIQPEQNRRAYYNQPIEADARQYAAITSGQILAEQKIQHSSNKGINSFMAKTDSSQVSAAIENKGIQSFREKSSGMGSNSDAGTTNAVQTEGTGQASGNGQGSGSGQGR
jgi:hypothetical protein